MHFKLFRRYWQLPLVMLWLGEAAALVLAGVLAQHFSGSVAGGIYSPASAVLFCACVLISMIGMGLFSRRLRERTAGIVARLTFSVLLGGIGSGTLLILLPMESWSLRTVLIAMVLAWFALLLVWLIRRTIVDEEKFKRRVLAFGAGRNAHRITELRRRADRRGFRLVGYVRVEGEDPQVPAGKIVATGESLREYVKEQEVDEIVVAMDDRRRHFPLKELLNCRLDGVEISELVSFLEREAGKVYLDVLNPSWIIFSDGFRRDRARQLTERCFDLLASILVLAVSTPVMLLTALAIKLEEGLRAPIFYSQDRVGINGQIFKVLKFRSMRIDAESDGKARWAQADDNRITRVGGLIRKLRIDELPQILNVLKGDMSFVGPRPERPEFVSELTAQIPYYGERHSVKPGITGWAQLCYPYGSSVQDATEKLQYDLFYVKNHNLLFDVLILLQTLEVIVMGKGAR